MVFQEMRRNKQQLEESECLEILENGTSGVLALLGENDYPYTVPISYACCKSKIYFHSAKTGHKIDAIKKHNKASFCVIAQDQIVPEEYTTYFKSIVAFGKIRILEDKAEIYNAIELIAKKYYPKDSKENREHVIENAQGRLCMLELSIEHLTGKEAIELSSKRKEAKK
ncbi:5-nitroimidazole antibiotic resistance protein [bacterium D16-51]|nr:5-nitroimidazole antibiotic resistance protein [bacterium D16-59]RKI62861.1 5-nitroimidazole antibiotic resistance protein [bacterium D16-51]